MPDQPQTTEWQTILDGCKRFYRNERRRGQIEVMDELPEHLKIPNSPDRSQTTISVGLQRALRDAMIVESGLKVTDADAHRVILRLREYGAEVVYTSQIEQWLEMANFAASSTKPGKSVLFVGMNVGNSEPQTTQLAYYRPERLAHLAGVEIGLRTRKRLDDIRGVIMPSGHEISALLDIIDLLREGIDVQQR